MDVEMAPRRVGARNEPPKKAGTHGRTVYPPPPDLAPYLRRFVVAQTQAGLARFPAAPRSFLVIHLGRVAVRGPHRPTAAPGSAMLTGPTTRPFEGASPGDDFRLLICELTGIGVHALFGGVAPELVDHLEPLATFDGLARSLEHELVELPSDAHRVARLIRYFRGRVPERLDAHARYSRQYLDLLEAGGPARVGALTSELGISASLLRRATGRVCGVSPKTIASAERLTEALRDRVDHPDRPLTELAHALDFHDQAHFTRAFRRFTGFAPSRLPVDEFRLARLML